MVRAADAAGRRVRIRRQNGDVEAQAAGRQGEHPAKLAAAQDADRRAGREGKGRHQPPLGSPTVSGTDAARSARCCGQTGGQGGVGQGEDFGGQQAGVARPGLTHRQGSHRHAGRHLDDGEQGIQSVLRLEVDRNAQHRQVGHRGGHARQVSRPACAGDDHLESRPRRRPWRRRKGVRACDGPKRSSPHSRRPGRPGSQPRLSWSASRIGCP